eukprot:g4183.t1
MAALREAREESAKTEKETARMIRKVEELARKQMNAEGFSSCSKIDVPSSGTEKVGDSRSGSGSRLRRAQPTRPRRRKTPPPSRKQFVMNGRLYIDGRTCEDVLGKGVLCEAVVDSYGEWTPARVEEVVVLASGRRRYAVRAFLPKGWTETEDVTSGSRGALYVGFGKVTHSRPVFDMKRSGVRSVVGDIPSYALGSETFHVFSDCLRLCPAIPREFSGNGDDRNGDKDRLKDDSTKTTPKSSNPMLGRWETVGKSDGALVVADENNLDEEEDEDVPRKSDFLNAPNIGATDAYDVMNPWGGEYRGVDLKRTEKRNLKTLQEETLSITAIDGGDVAFKKKKRTKKKRRRTSRAPSEK